MRGGAKLSGGVLSGRHCGFPSGRLTLVAKLFRELAQRDAPDVVAQVVGEHLRLLDAVFQVCQVLIVKNLVVVWRVEDVEDVVAELDHSVCRAVDDNGWEGKAGGQKASAGRGRVSSHRRTILRAAQDWPADSRRPRTNVIGIALNVFDKLGDALHGTALLAVDGKADNEQRNAGDDEAAGRHKEDAVAAAALLPHAAVAARAAAPPHHDDHNEDDGHRGERQRSLEADPLAVLDGGFEFCVEAGVGRGSWLLCGWRGLFCAGCGAGLGRP